MKLTEGTCLAIPHLNHSFPQERNAEKLFKFPLGPEIFSPLVGCATWLGSLHSVSRAQYPGDIVAQTVRDPLAAAKLGERRKTEKYAAIYNGNALRVFIPLAVSTSGGWGPQSKIVFDRIIGAESNALRLPPAVIRRRLYGALSLRIIRSNAWAVIDRCPDRLERRQFD